MKVGNMSILDSFTTQFGLVKKIDAFGFMDYLKKNPSEQKAR